MTKPFFLAQQTDTSIIKPCGYDSFEAAATYLVLSCFMPRIMGCYTETIDT